MRYTQLNDQAPFLRHYYSGGDTRPALWLSRESINMFVGMLPEKEHGWSREMEALVTLYWLASGAYYRVTADAFGVPISTVC